MANITFFIKYFCVLLIGLILLINISIGFDCDQVQYESSYSNIEWKRTDPKFVCINGLNGTSIWSIWSEVELTVMTERKQDVKFISGQSCEEVIEKYHNLSSSWLPSFTSWFSTAGDSGKTSVTVLPYGKHCIGISSDANFSLEVIVHKLRLLYPVLMIVGILLFFNAGEMSRNVFFYYSSGVSMGMILSILLLVFVISRLIPKRSIGYAFLLCGSSLVAYILQLTKHHITSKPFEGNWIVCSYFIISGLVSFLYCYHRGPVTSDRGFDIMRWCLQAFALFLIYYGIRCEKIALTFVLVLVATRWISLQRTLPPFVFWRWMPYRFQSYFFKPKLITMEEYEKQGREETARALTSLRQYCESPDCDTWRVVSRLKSPKRFSSFVSSGGHLTEEEQREYDEISFEATPFMTSDEDSDTELASINLDFSEKNTEAI